MLSSKQQKLTLWGFSSEQSHFQQKAPSTGGSLFRALSTLLARAKRTGRARAQARDRVPCSPALLSNDFYKSLRCQLTTALLVAIAGQGTLQHEQVYSPKSSALHRLQERHDT